MKNNHFIKLIAVTVSSMGLTLVSSFILARLLSVQDRGLHQLFVTSVSYVVTLATGGVGFAFALSMRHRQYQHWQRYFILFLAFAIIVAGIAVFLFDVTNYYALFIINVLLTAILTITLEKSKIDPKMIVYRRLTLQQPILLVLVYGVTYALWQEQPLKIALYLLTLYSAIQAIFCLIYLYQMDKDFSQRNKIEKINPKFFFTTWFKQNLLQIFGATTTSLDKFLAVSFLGNYTLGLYTVCIAFDSLLTKFINMLADYYYSGLLNKLNRIKSVLAVIGLISISALILVPLLAKPVIVFFFSSKYAEVAPVLIWFIVNAIIAGLSWVLSQNMLLLGKQVLLFVRQLIAIVVFVVLFYLLRDLQLYGLAYAFIGASLTRLLISLIYYFKYPITDILVSNTTE
ncbi:oligosaccharide flippase family protein [Lonepinella koalarum]|uniref:lipopolysaccharide biosynthesis protein n=1 Tax=Lonepinella koalarum TaxID=53417 RepID=UPI0011E466FD|nr:oligosaccharide flippase family protein [Lonepinella koalarum]TYG33518.1 oligosaccharide flippase family protein [Lonepinella koalarum]